MRNIIFSFIFLGALSCFTAKAQHSVRHVVSNLHANESNDWTLKNIKYIIANRDTVAFIALLQDVESGLVKKNVLYSAKGEVIRFKNPDDFNAFFTTREVNKNRNFYSVIYILFSNPPVFRDKFYFKKKRVLCDDFFESTLCFSREEKIEDIINKKSFNNRNWKRFISIRNSETKIVAIDIVFNKNGLKFLTYSLL